MKLSNVAPQLKLLNWSKILMQGAVVLTIVVAVSLASYFKGSAAGQVKCAEAQSKAMETLAVDLASQIQTQHKEMESRFATADAATRDFIETQAELTKIQEGISDAIKLRASNPACVPTAAERRMYQAIADKTRDP